MQISRPITLIQRVYCAMHMKTTGFVRFVLQMCCSRLFKWTNQTRGKRGLATSQIAPIRNKKEALNSLCTWSVMIPLCLKDKLMSHAYWGFPAKTLNFNSWLSIWLYKHLMTVNRRNTYTIYLRKRCYPNRGFWLMTSRSNIVKPARSHLQACFIDNKPMWKLFRLRKVVHEYEHVIYSSTNSAFLVIFSHASRTCSANKQMQAHHQAKQRRWT